MDSLIGLNGAEIMGLVCLLTAGIVGTLRSLLK